MPIDEYFAAQQANRTNLIRLPAFQRLVPLIDTLYNQAVRLVPRDRPGIYGQVLLVCHSSFLSAAGLLAQAQPRDAAPITRRAIEAIRLVAAVKNDPAVLQAWLAYEQRQARWQARQEGRMPERLNVHLPISHPLVAELMDTWGIVSDAAVHFTPEYFIDLAWAYRKGPAGREVYLNYFIDDVDSIVRDVIITTGSHAKMLRILDWCWNGALARSREWARTMEELYAEGEKISASRAGK